MDIVAADTAAPPAASVPQTKLLRLASTCGDACSVVADSSAAWSWLQELACGSDMNPSSKKNGHRGRSPEKRKNAGCLAGGPDFLLQQARHRHSPDKSNREIGFFGPQIQNQSGTLRKSAGRAFHILKSGCRRSAPGSGAKKPGVHACCASKPVSREGRAHRGL